MAFGQPKVQLIDGPLAGHVVGYTWPLPRTLVVADKRGGIRWHDYTQTTHPDRYRHSNRCPCWDPDTRPVDLDSP